MLSRNQCSRPAATGAESTDRPARASCWSGRWSAPGRSCLATTRMEAAASMHAAEVAHALGDHGASDVGVDPGCHVGRAVEGRPCGGFPNTRRSMMRVETSLFSARLVTSTPRSRAEVSASGPCQERTGMSMASPTGMVAVEKAMLDLSILLERWWRERSRECPLSVLPTRCAGSPPRR